MVSKVVNDFLISIIVTCYNEEKYIGKCIESILNQECDSVEIIVIDDFSTDSSLNIIRKYRDKIKIYAFNENHGLSYARNFGMKHSLGKYLMFVDGDDYIAKGVLNDIKNQLLQDSPDVLFGLIETFKEHPNVVNRWNEPLIENPNIFNDISNGDILLLLRELKFKMPPAQRYIVRKGFIEKNDLQFEPIYHEDELWTPQILCLAQSIKFLCKTLFYHMITDNGLGGRLNELDMESYLYICQKLINFSNHLNDEKKIQFVILRCMYSITKISTRLQEWEDERRNNFLIKNGEKLDSITYQLNDKL